MKNLRASPCSGRQNSDAGTTLTVSRRPITADSSPSLELNHRPDDYALVA